MGYNEGYKLSREIGQYTHFDHVTLFEEDVEVLNLYTKNHFFIWLLQ